MALLEHRPTPAARVECAVGIEGHEVSGLRGIHPLASEKAAEQYPPRVVSGIQPAARLHLGHCFGALQQHIAYHHEYPGQTFYFIADYHALTRGDPPEELERNTLELATTYLALGLDPNKATLYRQSDVPECTELTWILSCVTSAMSLQRNPPAREAGVASSPRPSAGLLNYPVLMAADVLCLRGTVVPVGYDQRINMRLVRTIARRFNSRYGSQCFPAPAAVVDGGVVPGTDGRKMSALNGNEIPLFESFAATRRRIARIVTDNRGPLQPKDPERCTVFKLYSLAAPPCRTASLRQRYIDGTVSYEEAKRELAFELQEFTAAYQDLYHQLKADPDWVGDVLREGHRNAREEAKRTLEIVRSTIGVG